MSQSNSTPYSTLDPQLILDAIDDAGFRCNGSLFALNSYENRVYQVGIEDSAPLIAKFYRPHRWSDDAILEEHQFALELSEREIPVVPPIILNSGSTLHHYQDFRLALFTRQSGRALELDNLEQLEWMGRFIGRIHAIGSLSSFQHRQTLSLKTFGENSYRFLIENNFIPDSLLNNFSALMKIVFEKIQQTFQNVGEIKSIRLHGDFHPGNILWNDNGPWIVDLDDCLSGPAMQDLWMMLSGDNEQMTIQLNRILCGYQEFCDFNWHELKLAESLRALRMIRYAAWLAQRWEDPAFPLNFPWFNTMHYWQQLMRDLQEQVGLLDEMYS